MAIKKMDLKETNGMREFGHKFLLAYVGAFGVVGDKLGEWFELFVKRGERMEINARKRMSSNEKQMHKLAARVQKERKTAVAKAEKNVKRAVKKVQATV